MKKLVHTLALLVLLQGVVTVQPDPLHQGTRWRVYDDKGARVEEWRKSPFLPNGVDVYNKDGRYKGTIRPDPIAPDTYRGWEWQGRRAFPTTRSTK
jgi:hypothetical protein